MCGWVHAGGVRGGGLTPPLAPLWSFGPQRDAGRRRRAERRDVQGVGQPGSEARDRRVGGSGGGFVAP